MRERKVLLSLANERHFWRDSKRFEATFTKNRQSFPFLLAFVCEAEEEGRDCFLSIIAAATTTNTAIVIIIIVASKSVT